MMKKIIAGGVFAAMFVLPLSSFASTYGYINTSNNLQTIEAVSADQALGLPANMDVHSGVILLTTTNSTFNSNTGQTNLH